MNRGQLAQGIAKGMIHMLLFEQRVSEGQVQRDVPAAIFTEGRRDFRRSADVPGIDSSAIPREHGRSMHDVEGRVPKDTRAEIMKRDEFAVISKGTRNVPYGIRPSGIYVGGSRIHQAGDTKANKCEQRKKLGPGVDPSLIFLHKCKKAG